MAAATVRPEKTAALPAVATVIWWASSVAPCFSTSSR